MFVALEIATADNVVDIQPGKDVLDLIINTFKLQAYFVCHAML